MGAGVNSSLGMGNLELSLPTRHPGPGSKLKKSGLVTLILK